MKELLEKCKPLLWRSATLLGLLLLLFVSVHAIRLDRQPVQESHLTSKVYSPSENRWYSVKIPSQLDFAGEPVPLHDPDVRKRLDRELLINSYWHSQTLFLLKEFRQVVPVLEPILERHGMHKDFIYLCIAESALQPTAQSPQGAVGLWQFIKPTARMYGLVVNEEIDERQHTEKATEAAIRYLKDAKERFGSWTMAAAAFNRGMEGLEAAVKNQKTSNYYELYLNPETARYVYRILALKIILQNPQQYGFILNPEDEYTPVEYRTVTVDTSISSLPDFARQHGTTYKTLRMLNPWLISYSLTNKERKTYEIKLPM
ncbi:MAG: lytic transglycosylase domain-containing protein [Chitinophagales bacterium]|nr:lytic transglycosylase domain-containing protein [Chitinophagales bacterium]MDW8393991.1 lytic transglycosylase domain-containing protein [Chitinophagales bacterium]